MSNKYEIDKNKSIIKDSLKDSILIESDNLTALPFLIDKFNNLIDFIYLDPPYNTKKKNFRYNDSISSHEEWLVFMEKRLVLAKKLLSKKGVVFISINDDEYAYLKVLMDKIFGEESFVCSFIWKSGDGVSNDSSRNISISHEYILCYANSDFKFNLAPKDLSKFIEKLPYENFAYEGPIKKDGKFQLINLNKQKDYFVNIKLKDGSILHNYPSMAPQKSIDQWQESGDIVVNSKNIVYYKSYLAEEKQGKNYRTILEDLGTSKGAGLKLKKILGFAVEKMYPKPVELIKHLLIIASNKDSIVLDFFAGSGTTGQSVWELNLEDNGSRQFVLVTNNEVRESMQKKLEKNNIIEGSSEWEKHGLCQEVTYPRLIKVKPENCGLLYLKLKNI